MLHNTQDRIPQHHQQQQQLHYRHHFYDDEDGGGGGGGGGDTFGSDRTLQWIGSSHFDRDPILNVWPSSRTFILNLQSDQLSLPFLNGTAHYEPYNVMMFDHDHVNTTMATTTPTDTTTTDVSPIISQHSAKSIEQLLTWEIMVTLMLPYSIIFILSIIGNLLVIITLTLDRSMRSVTNIFLLNLAISDLLLGVFCMPFTLVGVLLRRFIFGTFMCHLISYFQSVSVAVSVWTLVAMSIERYYAICHPFRSRESRQTKKHAYRILALVWTLAFITMSPTAIVSKLQKINLTDHYKCREAWPSFLHKQIFTLFLDFILLIIPLIIMVLTYSSIALTLRNNVQNNSNIINSSCLPSSGKKRISIPDQEHHRTRSFKFRRESSVECTMETTTTTTTTTNNCRAAYQSLSQSRQTSETSENNANDGKNGHTINGGNNHHHHHHQHNHNLNQDGCLVHLEPPPPIQRDSSNGGGGGSKRMKNGWTKCNGQNGNHQSKTILRVSTNHPGVNNRQRRIITMLFVVVIEFFICWSPIFILDTMALYRPAMVYGASQKISQWIGIDLISVCHLLCFCSSCTNPITYCFMNQRFRYHFMSMFRCRTVKPTGHQSNNSAIINS